MKDYILFFWVLVAIMVGIIIVFIVLEGRGHENLFQKRW